MKFVEILKKKTQDNPGTRTPMIAFIGTSITQGCFEVYEDNGRIRTIFDARSGYPEKIKEILQVLYPEAPVSIINSGVNGSGVRAGVEILKRDVIGYNPDLLIVDFALNDSMGGLEGIDGYKDALREIFAEARKANIETIFMTPNMMNTHRSRVTPDGMYAELSERFAKIQNEGVLDAYINAAREVCKEQNVRLCDCYAMWKHLYACGVDTTELLANGLNHPIREMHYLFAWELVRTILSE